MGTAPPRNEAERASRNRVASLGGLDILANNAGIAIPKTFEESTLEEFDRVINIRGTLVTTRAALRHMKNDGRAIMIGSCVGELR